MKKYILLLVGASALMLSCMNGTDKKQVKTISESAPAEMKSADTIMFSPEKKEFFVKTFESYKEEAHRRQVSNAEITDSLLLVNDAYLDTFIELVEANKFQELLDRLEDQYDIIRSLPGNSVDNEFSLSIVYRDLYRKFCKSEIEFVEKSIKPVESLKAHIEVLELANKEMPRPDHYGVQDGDLEMVTQQLEEGKKLLKELREKSK